MAKSLRAKAKMAGRRKKREQGNYHAADAARVARISAKLLGKQPKAEGEEDEEVMEGEDAEEEVVEDDAEMKEEPKKISTSGPKDSGRAKWKEAKGFTNGKRKTNSRGQLQGKVKAGKTKRRR